MQQQAKAVVLGDPGVGKTSLVNALASQASRRESHGSPFVSVDVPKEMLEDIGSAASIPTSSQPSGSGSTPQGSVQGGDVCLKFWEHRGNADRREYETVFPGALFCIVVCDIRSPESANSAFNKWMAVRDSYMTESFLFVVGSFLDEVVHRRVEINEICKACAQRDAIYVEVSSLTGKNIPFLWHFIIQRINYMMNVKSHMQLQSRGNISGRSADDMGSSGAGRPAGSSPDKSGSRAAASSSTLSSSEDGKLVTPFLEGDVDLESIGSLLASTVGLDFWPGYEAEQENLTFIGKSITSIVNDISSINSSLSSLDGLNQSTIKDVVLEKCGDYRVRGEVNDAGPMYDEPDLEELRHSYELMGLTLPAALLEPEQSGPIQPVTPSALESVTVKMRVKLPDGAEAIMQLRHGIEDVKSQVARFLAQNNMQSDSLAFEKLVKLGSSLLADQIRAKQSQSAPESNAPANPNTVPKCVVRVKLPSGQTIETVVSRDEDAQVVAARVASEHGLSMGYQNKVWEQLRSAQKLSFKSVEAPAKKSGKPATVSRG
jgi:GTPase SAR1 family protein